MERKELTLTQKAVRADERSAVFVASTDDIDAHNESIDQTTWKLDDFRRHGPILWSHDSRDLPVGRATDIGVRDGKLEVTIKFADHERANTIWSLVDQGFIKACSVGFQPGEATYEKRGDKSILVWKHCTLREISIVNVGANAAALRKALGGSLPGERAATRLADIWATRDSQESHDPCDVVRELQRQGTLTPEQQAQETLDRCVEEGRRKAGGAR